MGLLRWFKQKFNVGGLKVKIVEVEPLDDPAGWVKGKVTFSTGQPVVAGLHYKLLCVTTKGTGEDKKVETATVCEQQVLVGVALDEPGSKTDDFAFEYDLRNWFEKRGGFLGAASRGFAFAQKALSEAKDEEYFVELTANIKSVWNSPSDRKRVSVSAVT